MPKLCDNRSVGGIGQLGSSRSGGIGHPSLLVQLGGDDDLRRAIVKGSVSSPTLERKESVDKSRGGSWIFEVGNFGGNQGTAQWNPQAKFFAYVAQLPFVTGSGTTNLTGLYLELDPPTSI
jgi:hypothetical protein